MQQNISSIGGLYSRLGNKYIYLFFSVCLLLCACQQEQEQFQPPSPEVTVASPLVKEIVEWDEYTGRLQAVEEVEIRARVSGYLESIHFKDGAITDNGFTRTMLGEGDINFPWLMKRLDEIGYAGDIALEYELPEPAVDLGLKAWYKAYEAM